MVSLESTLGSEGLACQKRRAYAGKVTLDLTCSSVGNSTANLALYQPLFCRCPAAVTTSQYDMYPHEGDLPQIAL